MLATRRPFPLVEGELREAKNRQLAAALYALVLNVTRRRARACLATNSISPTRPHLPEMGLSPVPAARPAARKMTEHGLGGRARRGPRAYWQVA
jgi:hypothetical protein